MVENKLKSGLAKLTEQSKCFLEDKKLDIDYFGFHQDIELEEAIEMYRYYTK